MKTKFKTVLLIHQNERELQSLSIKLIREGYFIITERTATAALKILRRTNMDLVISSGTFKDIQPQNFLTEIQSLGFIDRTIYISNQESIEEFFQFGSLGLYRYVASRISSNSLFSIVQEFFEDLGVLFYYAKAVESSESMSTHFFQQNWKDLSGINISAPTERT
jgi:DNA-binding NtrC family response regulator